MKQKQSRERKRGNSLDGKTWIRNSISVWNDIRKNKDEMKLPHPAIFPKELIKRLIYSFMRPDDEIVLDPFVGAGATLVAAKECGKSGIGFDVSAEYASLSIKRIAEQENPFEKSIDDYVIYQADASKISNFLKPESLDICITSPPYWDILSRKRTADCKEVKDYEEQEGNLAGIHNYEQFLQSLKSVFKGVFDCLKAKRYCIVVVMDIRKKSKFYPFHIDLARSLCSVGFLLDDIIIWDRKHEYNNLRPLGYPSVFRINKVHEYIMIFQKPVI